MRARILTITMRTEELEGMVQRYREVIVPSAKAQTGFKGLMLMTDAATGVAHSITFWESEDQGWAPEEYQRLLTAFNDTLTIQSFARQDFEVRVQVKG
jgi:hypothetical protein